MASPVPAPKTPLTGKGSNTSTPRQEVGTPDWSMAEVQEFVPQGFEGAHMVSLKSEVSISPSPTIRGCFLRIKKPAGLLTLEDPPAW
jgi:PAB-dependent poly(A)-specific ribonuclease subunit 3